MAILQSTIKLVRKADCSMLLFCGVVVFLSFFASIPDVAAQQGIPDTEQTRRIAAKKLLEVNTVEATIEDIIKELAKKIPPADKVQFSAVLAGAVNLPEAEEGMIVLLINHFTLDELIGLTAFYRTQQGETIKMKELIYFSDVMNLLGKDLKQGKKLWQELETQRDSANPPEAQGAFSQ